jgi:beta-lactamase regulating signal transducer with metallopeptidase domain
MLGNLTPTHTALIYFLARVTILCSLAVLLTLAIQRRSADLAHRVWVATLAGVLFLPLLNMIAPQWSLEAPQGVAPAHQRVELLANEAPSSDEMLAAAEDFNHAVDAPFVTNALSQTDSLAIPVRNTTLPDATTAGPHVNDPLSRIRTVVTFGWLNLFCLIWLFGAGYLLLRLAVAAVLLAKLIRSTALAPGEFLEWTASLARSLNVRHRFEVRLLPIGAMPMACWMGRWIVLVPANIVEWPIPLRRTVMAHELGHVARRDAWSDLLAQLVCRLFWPHPILWWASRAIPRLRERACDDWVLAFGAIEPPAYAGHLLEVISRCTSPAPLLAPAMARTSDIETRLRSLLVGRSSKLGRNPAVRILTVVACLGLTGAIAGGRVVGYEVVETAQEQKGEAPKQYADVQRSIDPAPADGPSITVSGVVATPDGKPIGGAELFLRAKIGGTYYSAGSTHNRDVLARTKTNAAGEFAFEKIAVPPRLEQIIDSLLRQQGGAQIVTVAEGQGARWDDVIALSNDKPMRIVLTPEAKVTGIVLDKEEKGIAGVNVGVWGVTNATADVDTFFRQPGDLNLMFSEILLAATTGKDGRFTLHHMPSDFRLLAFLEGPEIFHNSVVFDTGDHKEIAQINMVGGGGGMMALDRSPLRAVLDRKKSLTVKVIDHNGKPVVDGFLQLVGGAPGFGRQSTDSQGGTRFAIKSSDSMRILYSADPLHPRLGTSVKLNLAVGRDEDLAVQISLPQFKSVAGRVVDAETGKGIVGAYLAYARIQELQDNESVTQSMCVSGADGKFLLPVVAGRGSIRVQGSVFGYFVYDSFSRSLENKGKAQVEIDVPASGEVAEVKLELVRGLVMRGIVRNAAGKPAGGMLVEAQTLNQPYRDSAVISDSDGQFEISGFSPRANVILSVTGGANASTATLASDPEAPWDRTLVRKVDLQVKAGVTLTGQVLYQGKPRAGMAMRLIKGVGVERRTQFPTDVRTDADGYYRVQGLEVGDVYHLETLDTDGLADPAWQQQMGHQNTVKAGQAEIRLPDMHLIGYGQTLKGIVVDPKGKPMADVTVSANLGRGMSLRRQATGPPPWTKTDAQGRFELRQLPDESVELMAYVANPNGGRIDFPSRVRTKLNQQDIRIMLDPALREPVEDLDATKPGEKKK